MSPFYFSIYSPRQQRSKLLKMAKRQMLSSVPHTDYMYCWMLKCHCPQWRDLRFKLVWYGGDSLQMEQLCWRTVGRQRPHSRVAMRPCQMCILTIWLESFWDWQKAVAVWEGCLTATVEYMNPILQEVLWRTASKQNKKARFIYFLSVERGSLDGITTNEVID